MKKTFTGILFLLATLPALAACGRYDYSAHISETRSDVFCAETQEFSLTLSCLSREYPYASDGVAANKSDLVEISLTSYLEGVSAFRVTVLTEEPYGGEMSFRNARGDYFYSQSVKKFPENTLSVRVEWGEEKREIAATSVKTPSTLSVKEALDCAIKAERKTVDAMTQNGKFNGEFRVRLLKRDKTYYYVGIVGKDGGELSLLLDAESGALLARRGNAG